MQNKAEKRLVDWLATPLFLFAFLSLLLLIEVLFFLRKLSGGKLSYDKLYGCISSGTLWALRTFAGVNFKVFGHLPKTDLPLIVVSNHQSMFDIPAINVALTPLRLRYVAKKELAKGIPAISAALRTEGHALIDRSQGSSAVMLIEKMARESVEQNFNIVLFPEGTRSKDGKLRNFKFGGIEKIADTLGEIALLPVAISGSWEITRFSLFPIYYGAEIKLQILEPVIVRKGDVVEEYGQKIREAIIANVEKSQ